MLSCDFFTLFLQNIFYLKMSDSIFYLTALQLLDIMGTVEVATAQIPLRH